MAIVFVSYRRIGSEDAAGRIYDELRKHFSKDDIFMDVDSIPDGADFVKIIQDQVRECHVMLVIIGNNWVGQTSSRKRRIDDPNDFVRLEIEAALHRGMPIIPLLVSRATMPTPAELPASLRRITRLNARPVRSNPEFHRDMEYVIAAIELQQANWLAAEQERKDRDLRNREYATKAIASLGVTSSSTASRGRGLIGAGLSITRSIFSGALSRYTINAFRRVIFYVLVQALVVAVLAAAATIAVGSWLIHRFPPGIPTYVAAGWAALTTGGMVAMFIFLIEMIRALVKVLELAIAEAENLAHSDVAEDAHMGDATPASSPTQIGQTTLVETSSVTGPQSETASPHAPSVLNLPE